MKCMQTRDATTVHTLVGSCSGQGVSGGSWYEGEGELTRGGGGGCTTLGAVGCTTGAVGRTTGAVGRTTLGGRRAPGV